MTDDDQALLASFLEDALPRIERLVTRALRDGRTLGELAVVLERAFDGKISGGCGPREAVVQRWLSDPTLSPTRKRELAEKIRETPIHQVPVVLTIAREGYTAFAIQCLEGDVIAPSKPN